MDKRLGRKIIYGGAVFALMGILLYGVKYDQTPGVSPGERGSANAALIEKLKADVDAARQAAEAYKNKPSGDGYEEIAVQMKVLGKKREAALYRQQGDACFFLPSFVNPQELTWKYDERKYTLFIDGEQVHSGELLSFAPGDEKTMVCIRKGQEAEEYRLTLMQSDTLPSVFIWTDSGSMEYLNEDKTHEERGAFECVLADGTLDSAGRLSKISGRGYSSFQAGKKSYGIRFAAETDVLGMGKARRWVLQANAYDLSRMRNKVVYDLAREMGVPYAVESSYADVWFNGEYAGNYLLCERIEVAPERLEIDEGCLVEGIFFSRVEEEAESITAFESGTSWYEIKYPENISDEQLKKMQELMDEVFYLIEHSDSLENYERLWELADMESFIQMFLLDELSNEADLNRASTFYFTADDGKLYAGPVWDYDRSLGNVKSAEYELLDCFTVGLGEKLFKSPYFRQDAADSYNERYRDMIGCCESAYIERLQEQIASSIAMDTVRWSEESDNKYTIFNSVYDTFDDGAAYLKDYFGIRYRLIDDILNDPGKYHQAEFVNTGVTTEYVSQRLWIRHGENIPEDVMDYLAERYESDIWLDEDGREYQAEPVVADVRLLSGKTGEEP